MSKLSIGAKLMIPETVYLKAVEKPSYAVAKTDRKKNPSSATVPASDQDSLDQIAAVSKGQTEKTHRAKTGSKPSIYRVRKGDTIWGISRRFDVDPQDLMRWNRTMGQIKPGEKLKIFARQSS